jgi:hypothetical protein
MGYSFVAAPRRIATNHQVCKSAKRKIIALFKHLVRHQQRRIWNVEVQKLSPLSNSPPRMRHGMVKSDTLKGGELTELGASATIPYIPVCFRRRMSEDKIQTS